MQSTDSLDQRDLRTYLRILNKRKLTVGLVTVLVVIIGLGISFLQTPVYTASTQVIFPAQPATSALQTASNQFQPAAETLQRMLSDAQNFAEGDQTNEAAAAALHHKAKVNATISTTADILTLTASSTSNVDAANTTNEYAKAFIKAFVANQVAQYTAQVTALQTSIASLQAKAGDGNGIPQQQAAMTASINSLTQALQQLQAASQLVRNTGPSILQLATVPRTPSSPKLIINGVLALFGGLFLGTALVFLRDRLDDKVDSFREVEENSGGHPVVGIIPLVESWRKDSGHHIALIEDSDSNVAEAYRTLRTSIQFLGLDEPQRIIAMTSSTPDEGKSTATANLAVSFARAGQRVIAVSCDFRRPRLHEFFGLDNDVGATSVLLGQTSLQDALCTVADQPNLRILTAGPRPPNPAEILSLDRARHLVDVLAANADVVLLDCPPVLPVTDTLLISRLCDSMFIIAVAAGTKKNDLRRTYSLLAQVGAPARGTVINRVAPNRLDSTGYGYGYGYGYSSEEEVLDNGLLSRRRSKSAAQVERRFEVDAPAGQDRVPRPGGPNADVTLDGFSIPAHRDSRPSRSQAD